LIAISIKTEGAEQLKRAFDAAADRILVRTKRVMEDFAAPLIIEKAREQLANKAKNHTGLLAGSLYHSRARGRNAVVKLGWGYPYGSVLEYGPDKTVWEIRAKHAKALRIPLPGGVIYRRAVVHRWNSTMLREHYGPAIDAAWPMIEVKLAKAMELD